MRNDITAIKAVCLPNITTQQQTLNDAMIAAGITPPHKARKTSRGFLRWGKNNAYWLKEFDGGAIFGDLTTRESHRWFEENNKPLNAREMAERTAKLAQLRKQEKAEEERAYLEIADQCALRWDALPEAGKSAYLKCKQVDAFNVRFEDDALVIPLRDARGKLWSLQSIQSDGCKLFTKGGRKKGCFHTIGQIGDVLIVGEGYATLASIHMATGVTCIVAFDAGNLAPVVETLARKYPDATIIMAADDDRWKPAIGNTGRNKAQETAQRFGCAVVMPWFKDISKKPTDFNDLHILEGLEAVKAQFAGVLYVGE